MRSRTPLDHTPDTLETSGSVPSGIRPEIKIAFLSGARFFSPLTILRDVRE